MTKMVKQEKRTKTLLTLVTFVIGVGFLAGCGEKSTPDWFAEIDQKQDKLMKDFGGIANGLGDSTWGNFQSILPTLQDTDTQMQQDISDLSSVSSASQSDLSNWQVQLMRADRDLESDSKFLIEQIQTNNLQPMDVGRLGDSMQKAYSTWKEEIDLKKKYNVPIGNYGYGPDGQKYSQ